MISNPSDWSLLLVTENSRDPEPGVQTQNSFTTKARHGTWTAADRGIPDSLAVLDVLEALVQRKDGGQRWGQMLHVINRLAIWTLVPVRPNYCLFSFCFCPFYWKPGSTQTSSAVLVSTVRILRSHQHDCFSSALKRKSRGATSWFSFWRPQGQTRKGSWPMSQDCTPCSTPEVYTKWQNEEGEKLNV